MKSGSASSWVAGVVFGATLATASALVSAAPTTVPVAVSISIGEPSIAIPSDFVGLSFETKRTLANPYIPGDGPVKGPVPPRLFSADDKPLITYIKTLGVKSLRIGGNTADRATVPLPTREDIDSVFNFAKAADVKVIYTLRLRENAPSKMAEDAKYIGDRYAAQLSHFAIGNEPDAYFNVYEDYRTQLEAGMKAVSAAAPEAKFLGPCTTQAHPEWSANVARDFAKGRDGLTLVAQHFYPCGNGSKATDRDAAIEQLLSPKRQADYEKLRDRCVPASRDNGLGFRLEETNNFYLGGAPNASDTFASALWALDFMHWWAANGASGFNFHTSDFFPLTPDDKPTWYVAFAANAARSGYVAKPIAYALTAFKAAAPSHVATVVVTKPDDLNVTAYATTRSDGRVVLTVINRTIDRSEPAVSVALPSGFVATRRLVLAAPDASSASDITLGGKAISESGEWSGAFEPMPAGEVIVVAPASAILLELERRP